MGGGDITLRAEVMSQLPVWVYFLYVLVGLYLVPSVFAKLAMGGQKVIGWRKGIVVILASTAVMWFLTTCLLVTIMARYFDLGFEAIAMFFPMTIETFLTTKMLPIVLVGHAFVVFVFYRFEPLKKKRALP